MQVGVRKEDRKFLLFLNDDFNKSPKDFEYQRHIFGARDSPACAIDALQSSQRERGELGSHSFNLIKWCSNSRAFCNELQESLLTNEKDEIFTKNNRQMVLGVSWFPLTDMFAAHINKHNPDMLQ